MTDRRDLPILVVDDSPDMREVVARILEIGGYTTVGVPDAEAALAELDGRPFAAMILDNRLPGMPGVDLIKAVGDNPVLAGLPMILVTGDEVLLDRLGGPSIGSATYLLKPFRAHELLERVDRCLSESSPMRCGIDE